LKLFSTGPGCSGTLFSVKFNSAQAILLWLVNEPSGTTGCCLNYFLVFSPDGNTVFSLTD
jgi:hypothetical protein